MTAVRRRPLSWSTRPPWPSSRRRDAGLENLSAVEVPEEALKVIYRLGLLARFQARNRVEEADALNIGAACLVEVIDIGEAGAETLGRHQIVEPVSGIFEQHLLLETSVALVVSDECQAALLLEQGSGRARAGQRDRKRRELADVTHLALDPARHEGDRISHSID